MKSDSSYPAVRNWLEKNFDAEKCPTDCLDQFVSLTIKASGKFKIASLDMLRIMVLSPATAQYLFSKHWNDIFVEAILNHIKKEDKDSKVGQNVHLTAIKFLMNAFNTTEGRMHFQDWRVGISLIQFCCDSFDSPSENIVKHAVFLLVNFLQFFAGSKKPFKEVLIAALNKIDQHISSDKLTDEKNIFNLVLCECRILYQNEQACQFIEEEFMLFFKT